MSIKRRLKIHLNVQKELVLRLKGQTISIEKKFASIHRIADLYWHEQKIVFEIQCSHILQTEALERTRDYQSIGITVIWLLHDKTFNKTIVTPSERSLRHLGALYTNIDGLKVGVVYDQKDKIAYRTRIKRGLPTIIDIRNSQALKNHIKQMKPTTRLNIKKWYNQLLVKLFFKVG